VALPSLTDQAERLVRLGVHDLAGIPAVRLHEAAARCPAGSLLVTSARPSALAPPYAALALDRGEAYRDRADGSYDARTPALWISNGTGRERRDAVKLGWCWWGNRHTWLGIASCGERRPV
jgi:hypothetical protein